MTDRRHFPFFLALDYTCRSFTGHGRTLELSSKGLLLELDRALPVGALVTMRIQWPALFDGKLPMLLKVGGSVLRHEGNSTEIRMLRHGFTVGAARQKANV